jgi:hypothetical protein
VERSSRVRVLRACPAPVDELTRAYLQAVDTSLPAFVDKLYVVGSAALGAWQPGHSDIDTVIFTARVPTKDDLVALHEIHAAMPAKPHLDGVYLSPEDDWTSDNQEVPHVVGGKFHTDRPCGELNPVLWLTLERYGVPVRGPAGASLGVPLDLPALRAYNLDNLRTYWQPQAEGIRRYVAELDPHDEMDAAYLTWIALGPARLHYTLATTDIISKLAAAEYVSEHFPDYTQLAERAVGWRTGCTDTFTAADLGAAADLTELIADDAWERWG